MNGTTPASDTGVVVRPPLLFLRTEGLALLAVSAVLFGAVGGTWLLFLLVLVPDAGMLGYVRDTGAGAVIYNLTHTYLPPAVLGVAGVVADVGLASSLALVWSAHIGMDRAPGYGLKYPDHFRHTHLGWIGGRPRKGSSSQAT